MTDQEKQIAGMTEKLKQYKQLLRQYRQNEAYMRDLNKYSGAAWIQEERLRIKLEKAVWNVVNDSPKYTAKEIKKYLDKVLRGLGLSE